MFSSQFCESIKTAYICDFQLNFAGFRKKCSHLNYCAHWLCNKGQLIEICDHYLKTPSSAQKIFPESFLEYFPEHEQNHQLLLLQRTANNLNNWQVSKLIQI